MTHPKLLARVSCALLASTALASGAARATVIDSVSVFATAPSGAIGADSVTIGDGSVFVAYTGGTSGRTGAGTSTVVQYSPSGAVQSTYGIAGNVDGLKVNPTTGIVYALQNQDANSTLSLINPVTKTVSGPLSYAAPPTSMGPGPLTVTTTSRSATEACCSATRTRPRPATPSSSASTRATPPPAR